MLSDIFKEEEPTKPEAPAAIEADSGLFAGLDSEHAQLVAILVKTSQWTRAAFEDQAKKLGLMPDGALEVINEWSLETLDEALIEDGEPLSVNLELLQDTTE